MTETFSFVGHIPSDFRNIHTNLQYSIVDLYIDTDNIATIEDGGKLSDSLHPKDLFFRVDHQTFRKLPRTNAIIFGVYAIPYYWKFSRTLIYQNSHPIMKRLEDLADSPLVPSLLIKVHEEGDKKLMDVRTIFIKNNAYH